MPSQAFFQMLAAAGIIATAIGGVGSFFAGQKEAKEKEQVANERINELQTALMISVKENAELIKAFTKETVEETATQQRKSEILDEAREELQQKKMVSPSQHRAVTGRKSK